MPRIMNIPNARIGFRNFEGREGKFNAAGERSFAVFLPADLAQELHEDGWNIKFPTEDNRSVDPDAPARDPYVNVAFGFDRFAPDIHVLIGDNHERMSEEEVSMLDWAEFENIDLVLRTSEWKVGNNSGKKAYLKKGYFTLVQDEFTKKYGF